MDKAGYEWTDNEAEAGLIGILACSVRQKAIDKVYSRIYKWNKWKNNKNLITFISGCILANGQSLWPELRSLEELLNELKGDIDAGHPELFFSEMLNDTEVGITYLILWI